MITEDITINNPRSKLSSLRSDFRKAKAGVLTLPLLVTNRSKLRGIKPSEIMTENADGSRVIDPILASLPESEYKQALLGLKFQLTETSKFVPAKNIPD